MKKISSNFNAEEHLERRRFGGKWLKSLRVSANLTQQQAANFMKVSHTFISAIEIGGPSLPKDRWSEYAVILKVDINLFTKNMVMFYEPEIFNSLIGPPSKRDLINGFSI